MPLHSSLFFHAWQTLLMIVIGIISFIVSKSDHQAKKSKGAGQYQRVLAPFYRSILLHAAVVLKREILTFSKAIVFGPRLFKECIHACITLS